MVDIRLVSRYIGGTYKAEWEKWAPVYKLARVEWKDPTIGLESEYLYDKLMEFARLNPEYHILEVAETQ